MVGFFYLFIAFFYFTLAYVTEVDIGLIDSVGQRWYSNVGIEEVIIFVEIRFLIRWSLLRD